MNSKTITHVRAPKDARCEGYITPGKVYRVEDQLGEDSVIIEDDDGAPIYAELRGSLHLGHADWEIVNLKKRKSAIAISVAAAGTFALAWWSPTHGTAFVLGVFVTYILEGVYKNEHE